MCTGDVSACMSLQLLCREQSGSEGTSCPARPERVDGLGNWIELENGGCLSLRMLLKLVAVLLDVSNIVGHKPSSLLRGNLRHLIGKPHWAKENS